MIGINRRVDFGVGSKGGRALVREQDTCHFTVVHLLVQYYGPTRLRMHSRTCPGGCIGGTSV